ncbi:type VII secretion-associated protein [Mycobacterium sp. ACS4331]|uniref:type VII secretion-associated protein n=1 Tax=Mycobacterium sp. ACS4331 TaxID=1834121 RepID=UPI0007FD23B0|nr:type VII secretion-associated protein [Mycobacterium sp. ACS4331]OBF16153.1 type VII secretion-associated protein [Mycobacterium sp. ACS4331]
MTRTVMCEMGPVSVRTLGPGRTIGGDPVLAAAVLEHEVDTLTVLGDDVVPTAEVWRRLLEPLLGGAATATLVHPTWWRPARCAVLAEAVATLCPAVLTTRADMVTAAGAALVEIAPRLVLIHRAREVPAAVPRPVLSDDPAAVVADVVRAVLDSQEPGPVWLDAPLDVPGARALAAGIADRLAAAGRASRTVDPLRWVSAGPETESLSGDRSRVGIRSAATVAVALLLSAALIWWMGSSPGPGPAGPTATLVEGRVAAAIPRDWTVRHVGTGPGSRRVEVVSPDTTKVLHLTQAPVPGRGMAEVAAQLRASLDSQSPGVFVDFNPGDQRAGRHVVSYREQRGARDIRWFVLVDGDTRIGIGCQSGRGAERDVAQVCDDAVRTARQIR